MIAASCGATAVLLPLLSAVGAVTVDRWLRRRHQLRVRSRLQSTPAPGPQDDGPEKVRRRREASQALSYKLSHFQHAQRRGGGGDDDDGSTIVLQEEGADDLGLLAAMADADADDCGGGGGGGPGGLPAVVRVVAVGTGGHIPGGWTTGRMLLDLASVSTTHPRTLSIPVIPPRISIDRGPTPPPAICDIFMLPLTPRPWHVYETPAGPRVLGRRTSRAGPGPAGGGRGAARAAGGAHVKRPAICYESWNSAPLCDSWWNHGSSWVFSGFGMCRS